MKDINTFLGHGRKADHQTSHIKAVGTINVASKGLINDEWMADD
jgi:hypothetical protein